MLNTLTTRPVVDAQIMETVLLGGDLSKLSPEQRVNYYRNVCDSLGLNPLTKPFNYIVLNGKMTLYANKDCADQLRAINSVSIDDIEIVESDKQFLVKVKGHDAHGRSDCEIGVVAKTDMQGNLANAQMKAVTKSKRRLTLSLCGLGWLDETEIETIPAAKPVNISIETGEIIEAQPLPMKPAPISEANQTGEPLPDIQVERPAQSKAVTNEVVTDSAWSNFSRLVEHAAVAGVNVLTYNRAEMTATKIDYASRYLQQAIEKAKAAK